MRWHLNEKTQDWLLRYISALEPGLTPDQIDSAVAKANGNDSDILMDDLSDLLDALGLFSGARPMSPHDVMRLCIETVRMRDGKPCEHSCGGRWLPIGAPSTLQCLCCGEVLASGWSEEKNEEARS